MKTFDPTKFRRNLTEKLDIPIGFAKERMWIDTGNYALNRLISGDYHRGMPLGKVNMLAGESGSGKSLIAANIMKNAQEKLNAFVLFLDSEGVDEEEWYVNAGVHVGEHEFLRVPINTVNDCTARVSSFINEFNSQGSDQPLLIVIDSLGMLETDSGFENFQKGAMKGDQGQQAKQLKRFIKNCVYMIEQKNIGFLMTNHTYQSMDMFNPDQKITGGDGIIYASSIVLATRKKKLKDIHTDKEIATSTGVQGITCDAMIYKSRFSKPFEKTSIEVPWSQGIDPYSGLVSFKAPTKGNPGGLFEQDGLLVSVGNKLCYTDKKGVEHKYFRKDIPTSLLDQIMEENPFTVSREELDEAAKRDADLEDTIEDTIEE
jgi:RecA/RadA recombinase